VEVSEKKNLRGRARISGSLALFPQQIMVDTELQKLATLTIITMFKKYSLVLLVLSFFGCTDNQICDPLDVFNCCDPGLDPFCAQRFGSFSGFPNNSGQGLGLFGPGGFFRSASLTKRALDSSGVSGAWNVSLKKESGSCAGAPAQIDGVGAITQVKRRVTVSIPGLGIYRGNTNSQGFSASGSYFKPGSFCFGNANLKFSSIQPTTAAVRGSASVKCLGLRRCTVNYVGSATR